MDDNRPGFPTGCAEAKKALEAGRLVYRWGGHAGHWGHWIVTELSARFGVEVEGFGLCCVSESPSFTEGYNSVVIAEIDRKYGSGAFRSLITEAKVQSEETLYEARRRWLERNNFGPDGRHL